MPESICWNMHSCHIWNVFSRYQGKSWQILHSIKNAETRKIQWTSETLKDCGWNVGQSDFDGGRHHTCPVGAVEMLTNSGLKTQITVRRRRNIVSFTLQFSGDDCVVVIFGVRWGIIYRRHTTLRCRTSRTNHSTWGHAVWYFGAYLTSMGASFLLPSTGVHELYKLWGRVRNVGSWSSS